MNARLGSPGHKWFVTRYTIQLEYINEIDGKRFTKKLKPHFKSENLKEAQDVVKLFPSGKSIPVYYNPDHPFKSYIKFR